MTLFDMKKKALGLIEELNPDSEILTDDPDIATKINEVINQIMFELVRLKKIPKYVELAINEGDIIDFAAIEQECGYEVYQVVKIDGVRCSPRADGTIFKMLENGTAEISFYVFPERITEKTKDKGYEFELTTDVLEIMPYGIAADLLKSDVSAEYGNIYATRYESMKQMLDPRFQMTNIWVEGGINI